ncbi:sulfatase-like hydrolase/transferase [Neorhodopirellula lusitana]|nr:sulfatase-like hydrolase/transferase [Neorhodopirellula lusitana]
MRALLMICSRLLCLTLVTLAGLPTCSAFADHYDVYLLAGQSNMDGRGTVSDLTDQQRKPNDDAIIYYRNLPTTSDGWQPLAPGFSIPPKYKEGLPSPTFGPEIGFAAKMLKASPDTKLALIKGSKGGTNLRADWKPGNQDDIESQGPRYRDFIETIRLATDDLTKRGDTFTIRCLLWHQGESDSKTNSKKHQERLEELITRLREDVKVADLPAVVGEVYDNGKRDKVRAAIQAVGTNGDHTGFVSAEGLTTWDAGTHFDAASQLELGKRFADAVTKVVRKQATPDIELVSKQPNSRKSQPNVLFILADDLGYGDLGCYNPTSRIPTPNLDRLAQQGMRFTDAHSPCTVCTPTRYSLMTGQMAFRVPNGGRVFSGAGGPSLIAPDKLTLPKMLRDIGYSTACFGKWHIGLTFYDEAGEPIHDGSPESIQRIDFGRDIVGGPLDCGFDQFFGTACCPTTDWLYAYIDGKQIPVPPTSKLDKSKLPQHPYSNDNRIGYVAPDFDLEEVDMKFLEKSQRYLKEHVAKTPNQPFFLLHSAQAVHLPSFPGNAFKGKTDSGPHGDFIFELDWVVGELMKTLDELNLSDNTIVMFSSDNGPEVPTIYHMRKDYDHDGAHPWRGVKRDNWEGGHRVPFLVRWPGKVPANSTSTQLTSLTDVMATVAEITDVSLPNDAAEDSFSMLPAILDQDGGKPIRPYILQQGFRGKDSLAIRHGKWKLLNHKGSGGNNYDQPMLKQYDLPSDVSDENGSLYDLEADPGETKNLILEAPEVAEQLRSQLEKSIQNGRSSPARTER